MSLLTILAVPNGTGPAWTRWNTAVATGVELFQVFPQAFELKASEVGDEGSFAYGPLARTFDFDQAVAAGSGVVVTGDRGVIRGLQDLGVFKSAALPT